MFFTLDRKRTTKVGVCFLQILRRDFYLRDDWFNEGCHDVCFLQILRRDFHLRDDWFNQGCHGVCLSPNIKAWFSSTR